MLARGNPDQTGVYLLFFFFSGCGAVLYILFIYFISRFFGGIFPAPYTVVVPVTIATTRSLVVPARSDLYQSQLIKYKNITRQRTILQTRVFFPLKEKLLPKNFPYNKVRKKQTSLTITYQRLL